MTYTYLGLTPATLASGRPVTFGTELQDSDVTEADSHLPLAHAEPEPTPAPAPEPEPAPEPAPAEAPSLDPAPANAPAFTGRSES